MMRKCRAKMMRSLKALEMSRSSSTDSSRRAWESESIPRYSTTLLTPIAMLPEIFSWLR